MNFRIHINRRHTFSKAAESTTTPNRLSPPAWRNKCSAWFSCLQLMCAVIQLPNTCTVSRSLQPLKLPSDISTHELHPTHLQDTFADTCVGVRLLPFCRREHRSVIFSLYSKSIMSGVLNLKEPTCKI